MCHTLKAQLIKKDCYTTYKSQGDIYNNQQKYSQAIEQYKIAKNCKYLSQVQIKTLDDAIEVASKKVPIRNVRIITRRF
jgi:hypothetical protein